MLCWLTQLNFDLGSKYIYLVCTLAYLMMIWGALEIYLIGWISESERFRNDWSAIYILAHIDYTVLTTEDMKFNMCIFNVPVEREAMHLSIQMQSKMGQIPCAELEEYLLSPNFNFISTNTSWTVVCFPEHCHVTLNSLWSNWADVGLCKVNAG